jgi:hypothetical protein
MWVFFWFYWYNDNHRFTVCNTSIGEPDVKPSYYYYYWSPTQRSLTLNNNNNFLEVCIISSLYLSHMKFCCMTYIMVNFLELHLIKPSFFSNFGICCTFCNLCMGQQLPYKNCLIKVLPDCWATFSTVIER